MLAVKGDITIREMQIGDVGALVSSENLPTEHVTRISKALKEQIRNKKEDSNLPFSVLYKGEVIGKIDLEYTDAYKKALEYKDFKKAANMLVEIPNRDICDKILEEVIKMFILHCKEEGVLDLLGVPYKGPDGVFWLPRVLVSQRTV